MREVVVLSSPGCHLCGDALRTLEGLAREFHLSVREVDMTSAEGARLVELHRPLMPPAVILDDRLFSVGRLPRKKLRRELEGAA